MVDIAAILSTTVMSSPTVAATLTHEQVIIYMVMTYYTINIAAR